MLGWLLWVAMLTLRVQHGHGQNELAVPQRITVDQDLPAQSLRISWESDSTVFDIVIIRTELMDVVFNETVAVPAESSGGQRSWSWTSAVPLECTSHSVLLRARDHDTFSQWSPLETIPGRDLPEQTRAQMYPQDKVVAVGSNTTFCCIVGEGQIFDSIHYKSRILSTVRLSRRSYAVTATNQEPSIPSGTNVVCLSQKVIIQGAVVFVGFAPGDEGLVCETRDLVSAECRWNRGRTTHLSKTAILTNYTLNGRLCTEASKKNTQTTGQCNWESWEKTWTLVARNPLGSRQFTDSVDMYDRVRLLAPQNLTLPDVQAWNASLQWSWDVPAYATLTLICQLQLTNQGHTVTHNYTVSGQTRVLLENLWPDETYSAMVRCASQDRFWKWGDWSKALTLRTKMDCPKTPEMWIWMDSETTGRVLWKPLSTRDSHGRLIGYEVTLGIEGEEGWQSIALPEDEHSTPISLSNTTSDLVISVTAQNPAGRSLPATVAVPIFTADSEAVESELAGRDGGFDVTWTALPNTTGGYMVEWLNTGCVRQDCRVEWLNVPEGVTSARVQSGSLVAGVRYTVSVYAMSAGRPTLLERRHGYIEEMVPAQPVKELTANQNGADVQLSWDTVSMEKQRGFLRGYTIYLANVSDFYLLANITDPAVRQHLVRRLPITSYKFIVKAYTSAGEDEGSMVAIKLDVNTDMLIVEILGSLAVMTCVLILISIVCYKKRKWVKKEFYPDIPAPKLPGNWPAPQGTLDVKSSPHSVVQIVDSPEMVSSKEGLVMVPEEDEDYGNEPADTDSDEPALLRYYNHVVGDGRHVSDSSASSTSSGGSVSSAQTDVTYTGIQTSPSSLCGAAGQAEARPFSGGYRPQMQNQEDPPEPELEALTPEMARSGYKPQCTWRPDSPEPGSLNGSLGSPTSVTSSQFLLPDEAAEEEETPTSNGWFHNFLSGKS